MRKKLNRSAYREIRELYKIIKNLYVHSIFLLRLFFIMYDDEGHYCWGSLEEEIEEEEDESNYSMFICEYHVKL